MLADKCTTDLTDIVTHPASIGLGQCISAIRGSLAAGNGCSAIGSSASLRGTVHHTTTAGESDIRENCPAVQGVPR